MGSVTPVAWTVRIDEGGLLWLDPGDDQPSLRPALEDCAETLSPAGQSPALSTFWVDRLLRLAVEGGDRDIANGNLWVLTANGDVVEVRMEIDPPDSEPLAVVASNDLIRGLELLRSEVLEALARGRKLDDRHWSQKNPS